MFIQTIGLFNYSQRAQIGGPIIAFTIRSIPRYRNRVLKNLNFIFPHLSRKEKNDFLKDFSKNLGITFTEFLFNEEFHANQKIVFQNPKQLDEIHEAVRKNQPIIIVSGHFGPWEAVRAALKRNGLETGAIYRKSKNRFYQPHHHRAISAGGTPIFQAGRKGTGAMIRYLRRGGIVCIMIDQAVSDGHYLDFLGKPAKTTLAIANLAIRYKALLVPAYAMREVGINSIQVIVEPSIPFGTPEEMTKQVNESLTEKIRSHPTHWYWVHNRWK